MDGRDTIPSALHDGRRCTRDDPGEDIMNRIIGTFVALAASQLIACATPAQNTKLEGTIVVDRVHDVYHGAPIRLAFRAEDPEDPCERSACRAWTPVERCTVGDDDVTRLRVVLGHDLHDFSACTGDIDPDHQLELLAYIDLDGDGRLSEGEPRGTHRLLERSAKSDALELRIGQL
jgi:hypothetical protein